MLKIENPWIAGAMLSGKYASAGQEREKRERTMSQIDWAKIYAAMDKRVELKYQQLPKGEQIGKRSPEKNQPRPS